MPPNSRADTQTVAVSARTAYLTGCHQAAARAGVLFATAGLFALVALNLAGVPGFAIAATVAALVTASLGVVSYGSLGSRGAMLVTVDADNVYFGSEGHEIVSYPLTSLSAARRGGPANVTSTDGRHLTV